MDRKAFEASNKTGKIGETAFKYYVMRNYGFLCLDWDIAIEAPDYCFPAFDFQTLSYPTGVYLTHEIKTDNSFKPTVAIQIQEYRHNKWIKSGVLNPKCEAEMYWIYKAREGAFYVAGREQLAAWIKDNWAQLKDKAYVCGSESTGITRCIFLNINDWPFYRIKPYPTQHNFNYTYKGFRHA